jgi:hypothetical protein
MLHLVRANEPCPKSKRRSPKNTFAGSSAVPSSSTEPCEEGPVATCCSVAAWWLHADAAIWIYAVKKRRLQLTSDASNAHAVSRALAEERSKRGRIKNETKPRIKRANGGSPIVPCLESQP